MRNSAAMLVLPGITAGFCGQAAAQAIDRYYPANVPAYQEWAAAASPEQTDEIYGPLGIRAGAFTIDPSLTEGLEYDSNPLGLANSRGSAAINDSAAVAVNSNWARNAVNAAFTVDREDYLSLPRQSYTTWAATAGGEYDYADDKILGGYSHVYGVTLPTDVGSFGATQPIITQVDDIRLSDTIGQGRVSLVPAVTADFYDYSNGSSVIDRANALYNRQAVTGSVTAGYEFAGGHNVLVVVSDTLAGYSGGEALFRPASYNDVSVMGGLEYKQSALVIYRVLVGYEERSPTGSGVNSGTVTAPAAELDVIWKPSVLTTVTGKLSQSLQDAPASGAQGLSETSVSLAVAQSLRRNLQLDASAQYTSAAFANTSQTQSVFTFTGEATYSFNRNWALSLNYIFNQSGDSGTADTRFSRHQALLQLRFQL
jgi:hypothetical protein